MIKRQTPSKGDKATLVCNGDRKPVTVVAQASQPRSYIVEDDRGGRYWRTRSQLIMRTAGRTETVREISRRPSDGVVSSKTPSLVTMTGVRRRRQSRVVAKLPDCPLEQAKVISQVQPSPANNNLNVSGSYESPVGTHDQSCTPSPHEVPIERSKERTARMLTHLFFGRE